jgi:hypothetical protein
MLDTLEFSIHMDQKLVPKAVLAWVGRPGPILGWGPLHRAWSLMQYNLLKRMTQNSYTSLMHNNN